MSGILDVLDGWKDLIVKVFGEYPLAASLVTLAAVPVWLQFQNKVYRGKTVANTLLVLLGWAIVVPILGVLLWLLGELWDIVKAVVPTAASFVGSIFSIYQHHPYVVIALVCMAIPAYFAWKRWRPRFLPNRTVRVLCLAAAVIVVANIVSPIIPDSQTKSEPVKEVASTAPSSPASDPSRSGAKQTTSKPGEGSEPHSSSSIHTVPSASTAPSTNK
ncbi:hypothetical protein [Dyella monticola]|uniref:hypothetical protein n=1 Tax=Dyella monticola TaxID=1927958 RepID=UPI0011C01906|nr:hypothetical protein [Dyella monticola]